MAIVFYVVGGLLVACGGVWAAFELATTTLAGKYAGIVPVLIAAAYVMMFGAFFLALAAIIRRLDRIVDNTSPPFSEDDDEFAEPRGRYRDADPPPARREPPIR